MHFNHGCNLYPRSGAFEAMRALVVERVRSGSNVTSNVLLSGNSRLLNNWPPHYEEPIAVIARVLTENFNLILCFFQHSHGNRISYPIR